MYATKVKQAIVSAVQTSSAKYSVKFEELSTLKYCDEDASGLMVCFFYAIKLKFISFLVQHHIQAALPFCSHVF